MKKRSDLSVWVGCTNVCAAQCGGDYVEGDMDRDGRTEIDGEVDRSASTPKVPESPFAASKVNIYPQKQKRGRLNRWIGVGFFANGDSYMGEWEAPGTPKSGAANQGKEDGLGVRKWVVSEENELYDQYEGEFSKGTIHGLGLISTVEESYRHGKRPTKIGKAPKDVYYGEFHMGKKQGVGWFKWSNGDMYKGQFSDDQMNGQGILYLAETNKMAMGVWEMGRLKTRVSIDSVTEADWKTLRTMSEERAAQARARATAARAVDKAEQKRKSR